MDRLSQYLRRLPSKLGRMSRETKKEIKEITYDAQHMPKKRLTTIYNSIVVVSSLSTTAAYLLYNTYLKDRYIDKFILKVGDKPIQLNENLELLALRTWNTSHIGRYHKLMNLIYFFPCKGADIYSIGDFQSRTGVHIALPFNFTYNSVDDIKLKEVTLFGQSLKDSEVSNKKSEAMKQLIESLVLSENAKKFAITREIHFAENYRVITEAMNIMFSTMAAFGVGQQIILTLNIRRKFFLSLFLRSVSLISAFGVWFLLRQGYLYGWNVAADTAAVEQGPELYEGAIEYYQKILQRNAALYVLLGSEGKKRYTPEGEPKGIFTSVPSIKKRLENINELNPDLKESESKDETDSESLK